MTRGRILVNESFARGAIDQLNRGSTVGGGSFG